MRVSTVPNRLGGSTRLKNRHHQGMASLIAISVCLALASPAGAQGLFDGLLTGVELLIGDSVAASVVQEYGEPVMLPSSQQAWVDAVFADIVAQANRKEIPYKLNVLGSDVVNAFAAPGGHIYITTGLLKYIGSDTEALANVLGHEVAHVEHKHGMNALARQLGIGLLLELLFGGSEGNETLEIVTVVATELMHLGWSREQEYESDDLGQRLAAAAGYDPEGMVRFFNVLQELEGDEVPFLEFLSTHPLTSERADRAQSRANSLMVASRTSALPSPGATNIQGATGPSVLTKAGSPPRLHPNSSMGSAEQTLPTSPPAGSDLGRVISRRSRATLGSNYHDPAGRFSIRLPSGWEIAPRMVRDTTQFDGPDGSKISITVSSREPEVSGATHLALRTLDRYQESYPDLVRQLGPWNESIAGIPAAYTEYSYTAGDGTRLTEGGYFMVVGDAVYIIQFAEPSDRFMTSRSMYQSAVQTFSLGPHPED